MGSMPNTIHGHLWEPSQNLLTFTVEMGTVCHLCQGTMAAARQCLQISIDSCLSATRTSVSSLCPEILLTLMWITQFEHFPFLWSRILEAFQRKTSSYLGKTDYISKGEVKNTLRWLSGAGRTNAGSWGMGGCPEDWVGRRSLHRGGTELAKAWPWTT